MIIAPYDGYTKPSEIELYKFEIWVHTIDLPIGFYGKVKALAAKIGEFVDSEPSSFDFEGNFYRVRVRLDVRNPLKKAISLIRGGERVIFAVKYECLPDWCQVCGMMGHEFKEHGDGVQPPSALTYKNLRAPATTSWGTHCRNRNQKPQAQGGPPGASSEGGTEDLEEQHASDMELSDSNRKRSSQQVVEPTSQLGYTGMELVVAGKSSGDATPMSPPPKQDPKRTKTNQQSEKQVIAGLKKNIAAVAEAPPGDPGHLPGLAGARQQRSSELING